MPNWRFWEKHDNDEAVQPTLPGRTAVIGQPVPKPIDPPPPTESGDKAQRLARLKRRREGAQYDVSQAQLANEEFNPWQQRIKLLGEAIETVNHDLDELERLPKRELPGLPPAPIAIDEVRSDEPTAVIFRVGNQTFHYEADLDWAERGGPIVHGDLILRSGNPESLIPDSIPNDLKGELADHLTDSLFVFATDLRDRAIDGGPLPEHPTLSDLAQPCPECGGWRDWRGNCSECKRRQWRGQQLEAELNRLEGERAAELEDQAKWADRLPIARKRLLEIDGEIAAIGDS
jgi:hypothetical protein